MTKDRARIMVVDDDPDVLLLLRVVLEEHGFAPVLASDGQTALRRIDEERPDLVLLDVMMPVMDGWSVLEELAGRDRGPRVLVISAKSGDEDRARAGRLGATAYVTKPFTPEVLVSTINQVLGMAADEESVRWLQMLKELQAEAPAD